MVPTRRRKETEYPSSWRNMIDAQFEEDHTEIGLEAFANFIIPGFAPSVPELLILCHLALKDASKSSSSSVQRSLLPETSSSLPLPHTALILLRRLSLTNNPALLARVLPNCDPRNEAWHDQGDLSSLEREGRKIMRWKDFWEGLDRCGGDRQAKVRLGQEPPTKEDDARAQDRWWALADWAVDLWQKDLEAVWAWRASTEPETKHAAPIPLLLAQIPPTNPSDPLAQRWELNRPINVLLSAFANLPPQKAPVPEADGLEFLVVPRTADELDGAQWEKRRTVALRLLDLLLALAVPTVAHHKPLLSPTRLIEQLSSKLGLLPTPALLAIFPFHSLSPTMLATRAIVPLKLQLLGSILLGKPLVAPPSAATFEADVLTQGLPSARAAVLKLVLFQLLVGTDAEGMRARAPWRAKLVAGTWVGQSGSGEGWSLVKAMVTGVAGVVD